MLWRSIQKKNFTNLDSLLDFLEFAPDKRSCFINRPDFVLNLPYRLACKIKKSSFDDPILKQFVPTKDELVASGHKDPVNDHLFQKTPSLLQKYEGRALVVTTSACAMHCRYCFRQNYPYTTSDYLDEITLVKEDPTIEEILLSGGDPLSLSDEKLFKLLDSLDEIKHLKRIRFHTRFLVGIPERIHEGFLKKLAMLKKQIIFVVHINHKNEIDDEILNACKSIHKLGIPVLTQTVLLRGINDSVEALVDLFKELANNGIIPYYLHQFDPVLGAMHFEVSHNIGMSIHAELKNHLPGYAVPSYVQEIPGKKSKLPVHEIYSDSVACN
jgi:EF-P beta-lysylation protein EpmB